MLRGRLVTRAYTVVVYNLLLSTLNFRPLSTWTSKQTDSRWVIVVPSCTPQRVSTWINYRCVHGQTEEVLDLFRFGFCLALVKVNCWKANVFYATTRARPYQSQDEYTRTSTQLRLRMREFAPEKKPVQMTSLSINSLKIDTSMSSEDFWRRHPHFLEIMGISRLGISHWP